MGVPLDRKLASTSNISPLMKGWYYRSIFNVGRVELFFKHNFRAWLPSFAKFIVMFIKNFR